MKILTILINVAILADAQRKAFVDPQSNCRIECLNGGFCAYLVDNPNVHTCLCLLDMFHGDRCQYRVIESTTTTSTTAAPKELKSSHTGYGLHDPSVDLESTSYNTASQPDGHAAMNAVHADDENFKSGEDDDYTEGWNTGQSEEYIYDDQLEIKDTSTSATSVTLPSWLRDSSEADSKKHAQRAFSDKSEANAHKLLKLGQNSFPDDYNKNYHDNSGGDNDVNRDIKQTTLAQRTGGHSASWMRSQELISESESEDDGWMISKRRRVVLNRCSQYSPSILMITILLLPFLAVMPQSIRWC